MSMAKALPGAIAQYKFLSETYEFQAQVPEFVGQVFFVQIIFWQRSGVRLERAKAVMI